MEEKHYKILVRRYVENKLTNEELEIFIHLTQQGKLDGYIREAMDEELGLDENSLPAGIVKPKRELFFLRWWATAAVLTIALGTGTYFVITNKPAPWFSEKQSNSFVPYKKGIVHLVNSSRLIRKQILPDGSMVWLQPQSLLNYPSTFEGKRLRTVDIQGEAFFEVTKDNEHPFEIRSGNILTRVWGTSFRIEAVPGKITRVSVLTGKVSVSVVPHASTEEGRRSHLNVMLKPFEEATYGNAILKKMAVHQKTELLIWYKSNLSFESVALPTIINALNYNYKVNIKVLGPELSRYHVTADFNGKNLPDILLLICKSVHATYTFNGNEITILNLKQQKADH